MKTDIQPFQLDKAGLLALTPVQFRWREALGGRADVGLIAEEVAAVVPNLATYGPKKQYREDGSFLRDEHNLPVEDKTQLVPESVRYELLSVYLLALAQEQEGRIVKLESQLAQLRGKPN